MALQFSTSVRNARLDAVEVTTGASPTLQIRSGAAPANPAAAASGTLLVSISLPSNWLADAASGTKELSGTWQAAASAAGTAGHFRINQGATCHVQGSVTLTGGGGDMTLDNTNIGVGQQVTVGTFTLTEANG